MLDSSPLADVPPIDPWWDLYVPAAFSEVDTVLDAVEAAEMSLTGPARGDCLAVAARAFAVMGRPVEAERYAQKAFAAGGPEADALATLLAPDGLACAERRLEDGGRAGLRADAACDLAARLILTGDVPGARAAVERAQAACPGHAEAARWNRFFVEASDPMAHVRTALEPRRCRQARTPVARDAVDLLPVRRTGWVSVERYNRRVLGTPPAGNWAPAGTALGRLHDVGVGTTFFALEREYAKLEADHPLAVLELAADTLRAGVDEGRDVTGSAARFWGIVAGVDEPAMDDAAQLLVSLATADSRLARLGLDAAAWLAERRTAHATLWEGYAVWLSHVIGDIDAVPRALALAARRPVDPLAWRFAAEVLRASGEELALDRAIRSAERDPALAMTANEFQDTEPGPVRTVVTGRLMPRFEKPTRRRRARA